MSGSVKGIRRYCLGGLVMLGTAAALVMYDPIPEYNNFLDSRHELDDTVHLIPPPLNNLPGITGPAAQQSWEVKVKHPVSQAATDAGVTLVALDRTTDSTHLSGYPAVVYNTPTRIVVRGTFAQVRAFMPLLVNALKSGHITAVALHPAQGANGTPDESPTLEGRIDVAIMTLHT